MFLNSFATFSGGSDLTEPVHLHDSGRLWAGLLPWLATLLAIHPEAEVFEAALAVPAVFLVVLLGTLCLDRLHRWLPVLTVSLDHRSHGLLHAGRPSLHVARHNFLRAVVLGTP